METVDFSNLSPDELIALAERKRIEAAGVRVAAPALPTLVPQEDRYAVTAWGAPVYDFVVPSGQMCQLRKLQPEKLIGTGLLDKITRLPAFADELVTKSEGKPPVKQPDVSEDDMVALLEVLDELLPLVIVQPKVLSTPKPDASGAVAAKHPGTVYVDDIELADRVAIMEKSMEGVSRMDNFREGS